jgi:hypothetical protein
MSSDGASYRRRKVEDPLATLRLRFAEVELPIHPMKRMTHVKKICVHINVAPSESKYLSGT